MHKFHSKIKIVLACIAIIILLFSATFFVFSRRVIVMPTQPTAAPQFDIILTPDTSFGQSFVARYSMLMGVEVELVRQATSGTLIASLLSAPDASQSIAQVRIPVSELPEAGRYLIRFPPLADSVDRAYFLRLESEEMPADAAILFRGDGPLTYLHGTLYRGTEPQDQQLHFNLVLRGDSLLWDLLAFAGDTLAIFGFSLLLFVLPGYALLLLMAPHLAQDWRIALPSSPAISLALFPLFYLWFDLLGVPLNQTIVWLLCVTSGLLCVWGWRRRRENALDQQQQEKSRTSRPAPTPNPSPNTRGGERRMPPSSNTKGGERRMPPSLSIGRMPPSPPPACVRRIGGGAGGGGRFGGQQRGADIALLCLVGFLIFTRLWPIHILEGPSWGDSVQHTVIAQLLVDNQGLFATWLPYAPYESLTTHFGFSAAVALYAMLSGESVIPSTLLMGQLLNIFAILSLYPLALYVTGHRWAGVGTLLFAGLLSPMPAEYVNWGRYAQLSGQVVFGAGVLLFWHLLRQPTRRLRLALLTGVVLAGMALCYYRVPIIFVLFFVAWGLLYALPTWRTDWKMWRLRLTQVLIVALVGAGLLWPWVLNLLNSKLQKGVVAGITLEAPWEKIVNEYRAWLDVDVYVPESLLLLCAVALLVALFRWRRWPWLVALWSLFLVGSKATQLINLPLANYIQTFAIMIMLYIPTGLLLGWLVGETMAALRAPRLHFLLGSLIVGLGLFGMTQQVRVIKPNYVMITEPDLQAMAWIKQSLPQEARFLVNGFTIYSDTSAVGADGGWWLPLLTKRSNTMPPQYAMLNEQPITSEYTEEMVELVIDLREQPLDSPDRVQRLCEEGVTHIYSGQGQGLVGAGVAQLFNPVVLEANPALIEVYHHDQVRIFEILADVCPLE